MATKKLTETLRKPLFAIDGDWFTVGDTIISLAAIIGFIAVYLAAGYMDANL